MRRLLGLLLPALLSVALFLPATTAFAEAPAHEADTTLLLATEGGGEPLPGRTPRPPDSEANPNPPSDYEANFLWGAGVGLAVLVIGLVLFLGGLYWLLVKRPQAKAAKAKSGS